MYINERGQVNYHGFLKALRERNQVMTNVACKGICTVSGWNRFENGNRLGEKLMKDRLVARLGVSGEKYEDYLQPREYERWVHRMRIVRAIERKDLDCAKEELASYEALGKHNCVNHQFMKAMHYMILCLEGASEEELRDVITAAVKCTVSSVKKALAGAQLLSDQEVNLIAEKMRLASPSKSVKDVAAWRISEYEKLLAYMDVSHWENLQKAKVYPKIAHYIGELLLEREAAEQELRYGLEVCHKAMEFLRDTSRSFYLLELAKTREELALRLLALDIDSTEQESLKEMVRENAEWADALRELCEEYGLQTEMTDFCYLYYETECYNMVEVIEKRRNMFGLSRVRLSEGICTDKTLVRCERQGGNLSVDIMRELFERLGLCAEYRRAQMVTTDVEVVNAYYDRLVRLVNRKEYEKALDCVNELKTKIDLSLPYNRQEIERMGNYALYHNKEIDSEEFAQRIINTLGYTLDVSKLGEVLRNGEKDAYYFTRAELSCIYDLAFKVESNVSEVCLNIIEYICFEAVKEGVEEMRLFTYDYIMGEMASYLGDIGRFEESNEMSRIILKECLKHYRLVNLSSFVYNQVWNYQQDCGNDTICDNSYIGRKMQLCESLSKFIKNYNAAAFFQMKKENAI